MQQIKFNTPTVYSEKFQKRVGSRAQVAHGTAKQTSGGLQPKDLLRNKRGEIVSKKKHVEGKKSYKRIQPWAQAYMEARDHLQIEGWQTPKKGTDLYMLEQSMKIQTCWIPSAEFFLAGIALGAHGCVKYDLHGVEC